MHFDSLGLTDQALTLEAKSILLIDGHYQTLQKKASTAQIKINVVIVA